MKTYSAKLVAAAPGKRGQTTDYEAKGVTVTVEASDEASARRELSIRAHADQTARRAFGETGVLVRYVFLGESK